MSEYDQAFDPNIVIDHCDLISQSIDFALYCVYTMFPVGHSGHVSDNREQNGITVRQRRGTGKANVARRDNRGHRDKFFDSLKICHGSHGGNEKRNGP